jgi:hypothetical protein
MFAQYMGGEAPIKREIKLVKESDPQEMNDTVQQLEQAMSEQLQGKDGQIVALRQQILDLETNVSDMSNKIMNIESTLFVGMSSNVDSAATNSLSGWCGAPQVAKRNLELPPPPSENYFQRQMSPPAQAF